MYKVLEHLQEHQVTLVLRSVFKELKVLKVLHKVRKVLEVNKDLKVALETLV